MDEDQVNQSNSEESSQVGSRESEDRKRETSPINSMVGQRIDVSKFLDQRSIQLNDRITRLEAALLTTNNNVNTQKLTVERSFISINTSIVALQQSLKVISDGMNVSDKLEKIKDANDAKRERLLADNALVDNQEKVVETKIQAALSAPLKKIGIQANKILGGLVGFFNTALLGFMGLKTIELISALSSGNKEKLEEIKGRITKQLTIAGGIFLAINAGFAIALRSILRLGGFITRIAATNLLRKPIDLLLNLVRSGRLTSGGPRVNIPPSIQTKIKGSKIPTVDPKGRITGFKKINFSKATFFISLADELIRGRELPEAVSGAAIRGTTQAVVSPFIQRLARGNLLFRLGTIFGGQILADRFIGQPLANQFSDDLGGVIRNVAGLDPLITDISNVTRDTQNLLSSTDDSRVNIITVNGQERVSLNNPQTDNASIVGNTESSNPDNPYILNSVLEYNIIGV